MPSVKRGFGVVAVKWAVCGAAALASLACGYQPVTLPAGTGGASAAGSSQTTSGGSAVPGGGMSAAGGSVTNGGVATTGGNAPSGGTDASTGGAAGAGTGGGPNKPTNPNLTFTKIRIHNRFLAEAVAIGDFDKDGTLDIAAGRRWYKGPFVPGYNAATGEHFYRPGHEDLPTAGVEIEINSGVSDSWAAYSYDFNADGWDDIIQIAAPDMGPFEAKTADGPTSLHGGTGYWFQNPGATPSTTWQSHLISDDMKGEHKVFADMTGDGKFEILGACKNCVNPLTNENMTWGYWEANWANPTAAWTFHSVTRKYPFKDVDYGWLHGLGAGDVNGDMKPDLLERSGYWLQPAAAGAKWEFHNIAFSIPEHLDTLPDIGGANMHVYDVDGDGMNDIVTSLNSHGYGLAWFKQGPANTFTRTMIMNTPEEKAMYNNVAVSQLHTLWLIDMDGDGLKDIVTGKTFLAHPYNTGDAGGREPVEFYIWKLVRTPTAHFEPHLLDKDAGAELAAGGAREFTVRDINADGLLDIIVSSKRGLFVYLGKP
jgi:FG-GAP-like repeat